ncbi:MAG: formate dehydrogenase subunit alpha [Gammaproteobacteria bacterium]|jgi:formate dehydrogenase major subunit|nr:formate dehydrogenase subunit alpha [Gammaproteobacteria bacterium]
MLNFYQPQPDQGTPEKITGKQVTLQIDGVDVTVAEGTSVMRAASQSSVKIPRLCATDQLESFGSCRVCLVEIQGRKGYPASCTTPVEAGMQVRTQSDQLAKLRRNVMELYISDHPLDCLTCPTNGDCELQDTAGELGLREVRYGYSGANHLDSGKDTTNPYFTFDASKCIVCSRCVRACEEVQGTFALTVDGRGFDSVISAGQGEDFMSSECVSCGACVDACPTATLTEKSIIELGKPEHSVVTTCAYCGVGCSFQAEMKGDQVVRMTPHKQGKANQGHACVKGRFAFGYVTHKDRITQPMIRNSIAEEWTTVSWDEAVQFAAQRFTDIQAAHGKNSIGAISSSRCTNEEVYLVQKMVRTGFGNNNIDTCARVCHSPTGFGLKTTLGESAGTQTFASVDEADVVIVMGANPTDAHPVFASRLKRRLRAGAKLIVIDPRKIELVSSPHIKAEFHLPVRPGTNVTVLNALAHVIISEERHAEDYINERSDVEAFAKWRNFILDEKHSPENTADITGIDAAELRGAARLYAQAANAAIFYGLGVTEHSQGSTAVMAIANLAMLTGNLGREGVGVNPLRGQNNVQGSCDMGSFPHELPGYRHISDSQTRQLFEDEWKVSLDAEPGLRIPNMFDAALDGDFKGLYCQGEDIAQSDPNTQHVEAALTALECLVVQDIFLNETAKFAHVFLPGATFLEKDGTFTNAERRISRVRKAIAPLSGKADWQATMAFANALGCNMTYEHPSEIMAEIARLTPTFAGVSYEKLDQLGSIQWPCNAAAPEGTPIMHVDEFVRGKGFFALTEYVPTDERANRKFPLLLTTGRILSQYNVGAQTRRTENSQWHPEDIVEIHPHDAEERGISQGDWIGIQSRVGETVLRAEVTERVTPGVIYTTFHHPVSGANVITTENSDWATNCPEYKVTAVQVSKVSQPSSWQKRQKNYHDEQLQLLEKALQ